MTGLPVIRKTLYGVILALGICQLLISAWLAPNVFYNDSYTHGFNQQFQIVSTVVALLTWIWTSVLLSYNNQPNLVHPFTLSLPHFISFATFSLVWAAIGIMVLSQIPLVCNYASDDQGLNSTSCGLTITTGALSLVLSLLSICTAVIIFKTARKYGILKCRLAADDTEGYTSESSSLIFRSQSLDARITLYSLILALAFAADVIAPLNFAFSSIRRFMPVFSCMAWVFSALTWIWSSVLLSYNNRPSSNTALTRARVHFYSLVTFSAIWLAMSLMFASEAPNECSFEDFDGDYAGFSCGLFGADLALSLSISLLSGAGSLVIYRTVTRNGSLLDNVAKFDDEFYWKNMGLNKLNANS